MNTLRSLAPVLATLLASLLASAFAVAPASAADPADAPPALASTPEPRIEIGSCASGPPITIGLGDERAVLADAEREALLAEMTARYPVLQQDGFRPPVILLWHKTPSQWLYISLQPQALANGTLCFTASFIAQPFKITPALIRTYGH